MSSERQVEKDQDNEAKIDDDLSAIYSLKINSTEIKFEAPNLIKQKACCSENIPTL
jgi:hypothetical protein